MFALPPHRPVRQPRQRIAQGSSARLSRLHLTGSQLGLNALQCDADASDGIICGRAFIDRRLRGSRKLSLPVMTRTEQMAQEDEGLGGIIHPDTGPAQSSPIRFSVGSPMNFRRRSPPTSLAAAAAAAAALRSPADEVLSLPGAAADAAEPGAAGSGTMSPLTEQSGSSGGDESSSEQTSLLSAAAAAAVSADTGRTD